MNNNIGYIINLSSRFNAGNYLYYFFPAIASEKILHFKTLTEYQLPTLSENKQKEIERRIWELKNHWHLYRLDPKNEISEIKFNIVLDQTKWDFISENDYGCLVYAKLSYIKELLYKYFESKDLKKIRLQYFTIYKKNDERERIINQIDINNGLLKKPNTLFSWYTLNDFNQFTEQDYNLENTILQNPVEPNIQSQLEKKIDLLINKLEQKTPAFTKEIALKFKKYLVANFKTNSDLTRKEYRKELCVKFFTQAFSSVGLLRKSKDLLFRVPIDDTNAKSKLNSYEQLTALLVETISVFDKKDPLSFWSMGDDTPTLSLDKITFSEENKTALFSQYKTILNSFDEGSSKEIEKKRTTYFTFNEQLDPEAFYKIDQELINSFISVQQLHKDIPFFYSKKMYQKIKEKLQRNSFLPIEQLLKKQSFEITKKLQLTGDYGLAENTQEISFKEAKLKLEELKKAEKETTLTSLANEEEFIKKKEEFNKEIDKNHERLLVKLRSLPKLNEVLKFTVVILIISFIFMLPLYKFTFLKEASYFTVLLLISITVTALLTLFYLKNSVTKEFQNIKLKNIKLTTEFNSYVEGLIELAQNVRKSTLRRKNIEELEATLQYFSDKENKKTLYKDFYQDLVEQLDKNSYKLNEGTIDKLPDYNCSPYYDYRVATSKDVTKLTIKHGNGNKEKTFTSKEGIKSSINIIETVEFE